MCGSAVNDWLTTVALGSAETQHSQITLPQITAGLVHPMANHVDRQDTNSAPAVWTVMRFCVKAPTGEVAS